MKNNLKDNGITLVALVVTIIILLILAGVAINVALGDNGLFKKSKEAVNTWKSAETNEIEILDYLDREWNEIVNDKEIDDGYITFYVNDKPYRAFEGSSWEEFLNSGGSDLGFMIYRNFTVVFVSEEFGSMGVADDEESAFAVTPYDLIKSEHHYIANKDINYWD